MVFPENLFFGGKAAALQMCCRRWSSARHNPGWRELPAMRGDQPGRHSLARAALLVLARYRGFRLAVASRRVIAAVPPRALVQLALAVFSAGGFAFGVGAAPAFVRTGCLGRHGGGHLGGDRDRPDRLDGVILVGRVEPVAFGQHVDDRRIGHEIYPGGLFGRRRGLLNKRTRADLQHGQPRKGDQTRDGQPHRPDHCGPKPDKGATIVEIYHPVNIRAARLWLTALLVIPGRSRYERTRNPEVMCDFWIPGPREGRVPE